MFQLLALCQSEGEQLPLETSALKRFTEANVNTKLPYITHLLLINSMNLSEDHYQLMSGPRAMSLVSIRGVIAFQPFNS